MNINGAHFRTFKHVKPNNENIKYILNPNILNLSYISNIIS